MKFLRYILFVNLIFYISNYSQEVIINSFIENDQREPVISKISESNEIAFVWRSDNQVDSISEGDIFLRIFNNDLESNGDEILVNQITSGNQKNPQIASNGKGQFSVVWSSFDRSNSESFYDIKVRLFNQAISITDEILVNSFLSHSQTRPQVAMNEDGEFIVVWESWFQDGSERGIYAQKFDENGNKIGEEFLVNTTIQHSQARPVVKYFEDGRFIILWESWNEAEKGYNLFGKIYDKDGKVIKDEFMINTYTDNYQWFADITVYSNNYFDIVWCSWGQDGYDGGIYLKSFNSNYQSISDEVLVNSSTEYYQWLPKIKKLENDNKVIIWSSWKIDGSREGVYYKVLNKNNKAITLETRVNVNTESFQWEPDLAAINKNELIAVWSSWGEYSDNYEIVSRKLIPSYLVGLINSNKYEHANGISTTEFYVHVVDSNKLTSHEYEIYFEPFDAKYLQFFVKDLSTNETKIENFPLNFGKNVAYLTEEFDGIVVEIKPQFQLKLNLEKSYFVNNSGTNIQFKIEDPSYYPKISPIDVIIIWGDTDTLANGNYITPLDTALSTNIVREIELPFIARNISNGEKLNCLVFENPSSINQKWDPEELILFFAPEEYQNEAFDSHFQLQTFFNSDSKLMPNIGDTNFVFTQRPITTEDVYRFTTIPSDLVLGMKEQNLNNSFMLNQNYPNPFNPTTTISYTIPEGNPLQTARNLQETSVQLIIYDILGREVETLVNEKQKPGNYKVIFNAVNYSSGVYFYKLAFTNKQIVRKMILLR